MEEDIALSLEDTDVPKARRNKYENSRVYHLALVRGGTKNVIIRFLTKPKNYKIPLNSNIKLGRRDYESFREKSVDSKNDPDLNNFPEKYIGFLRVYNPEKASDVLDF